MTLVYTFSTAGTRPVVRDLKARTHCAGRRIDLSWTDPPDVVVTEYVLKRSRYTFSIVPDDFCEEIYRGTDRQYTDNQGGAGLDENAVFYYTVYYTDDGVNYYTSDEARVAGLSIKDFKEREGEHWLYNLLPQKIRESDSAPGAEQYLLRRYYSVLQCGIQLQRGLLDAYVYLVDADLIPAGAVGDARNQYAIIETLLGQLAFPPQRAIGIQAMRRMALGVERIRKFKGTCIGLKDFITTLTTWPVVECYEPGTGSCGGGSIFRTWDGVSGATYTSGAVAPAPGAPINISTPGTLTDASNPFSSGYFEGGVAIDIFGTVLCVASNSANALLFEDTTAQLAAEETYTVSSGGSTVTITRPPGGKPFNSHCFKSLKLKDSAGTVVTVDDNDVLAPDGLETELSLSGAIVSGAVSIAYGFSAEPQTYANRRPIMWLGAYSGEHYFLYNPRFDLRLRDTPRNPFDVLYGGYSATGGLLPGPFDVIFWIEAGVAEVVGQATGIGVTTLTDSTATWTPGEFVGMFLNPDRNQTSLYRVVANTATTITVDIDAGSLTNVTDAGANYFVLDQQNAMRYQSLTQTMGMFLPLSSKAYIYFY